jgi:hypothetical protein
MARNEEIDEAQSTFGGKKKNSENILRDISFANMM